MSTNSTRYYVFSKNVGTSRSLKNADTREDARNYKRSQRNPEIYGIFDRQTKQVIR